MFLFTNKVLDEGCLCARTQKIVRHLTFFDHQCCAYNEGEIRIDRNEADGSTSIIIELCGRRNETGRAYGI